MTTSQGHAASTSWTRARALAAASKNVSIGNARTFIHTFRNTDEAITLYDYLDNNPTFQDNYGKGILQQLASFMRQGTHKRRPKKNPKSLKNLRASYGDPTRTPRAGAPAPEAQQAAASIHLKEQLDPCLTEEDNWSLLRELRDLEIKYSRRNIDIGLIYLDRLHRNIRFETLIHP